MLGFPGFRNDTAPLRPSIIRSDARRPSRTSVLSHIRDMSKSFFTLPLGMLLAVTLAVSCDDPVDVGGRLVASTSSATGLNGQVTLAAQQPGGGTPPYVYQWHMSTTGGFTPDASNEIEGATSLIETVGSLSNGTTYFFRLVAGDDEGQSVTYAEITATPTAALLPGIASATPGDGQITLGATQPSGGTPPYAFQWHRATTSGFTPSAANAIAGMTALSGTDDDVTNGTTYFYRLVVTDADQGTAMYPEVSATPGEGLLPGTATATGLDGAVALSATAAVGGTPPYVYQWFRSTTSGFTPGAGNALAGFTDLTETDASVTNGTTYFYRLAAVDSDSTIVLYAEVSATPEPVSTDYPNRPTGLTEIITFTGTVEESNGDAFGHPDFGGWLMDSNAPADMIQVVSDPSNPTGSGSSLRFRYSEGFNPRSGIASANTFSAGTFKRLYVKLLMFYEDGAGDWTFGHKIFYIGAAPGSRNNTGSPTQSYNTNSNGRFRYHQQNFGGPEDELVDSAEDPPKGSNNSAPIARGRWVMLEHIFVAESAPGAADGQVQLFVDGELVGSRTGVSWVAADDPAVGFNGIEWYADVNEVPGGDVFYRLGELYVAGD